MWKDRVKHRRFVRGHYDRVKKSRRLVYFAKMAFLGVIALFIGSFIVLPLLAFNLPSPDEVVRREGFSTKILDRNGEALYDIFENQRRTPVSLDEVPEFLKQATIAIEDKNFYSHQGFDPLGMVRGLSRILTLGRAQGGSTLTQQLVKNVLLSPERTIFRKVNEFVLAIQIERKYSKDEILQMYLNGGELNGVRILSRTTVGGPICG